MRFGMIAAAAAALVCAQQANAAQTISYSSTGSYGGGLGASFSGVSQFDQRLGSLESVTLSFSVLAQIAGTANSYDANFAPTSSTFTPVAVFPAYLRAYNVTAQAILTPASAPVTLSGSRGIIFDFTGQGSATTSENLGAFIGSGFIRPTEFFNPSLSVAIQSATAANPNFVVGDTGGYINYTLTYGYSAFGAVPEPATWLLMCSGIAIVGGALRRRKNIAALA